MALTICNLGQAPFRLLCRRLRFMKYFLHLLAVLSFLLVYSVRLIAQKPFVEGTIIYKVSIGTPDKKIQSNGTYTFIVKGKKVKKVLKLDNGYDDIVIYDGNNNTLFSLQTVQDKKYAIQLSTEDMENKQKKYTGYRMKNEEGSMKIAGYQARKATVQYTDGSSFVCYYTPELSPGYESMYDRMPDIKVLPLSFTYLDDKGIAMYFIAVKVITDPIENYDFRVPPDYKVISYNEYKQMNK